MQLFAITYSNPSRTVRETFYFRATFATACLREVELVRSLGYRGWVPVTRRTVVR